MPISEGVVQVLHEGVPLSTMIEELLSRSAKPEIYGM